MPGKKEKKKKQEVEPEPLKPEDTEYDKEELKVKIATHEMRIRRYREENAKLKEAAEKMQQEKQRSSEQTQDMFKHLTERMDDRERQIARMRQEVAAQEDERRRVEQELSGQINAERDERRQQEEALQGQIAELQGQLDSVDHFLQQKDSMEREIDMLKQQAEDKQAKHKEEVDRLRELHKEEREKLRNDMIKKWRKTRLQVYKLTEDHLQTKTQQTIQENERLTRDLDVYARECREMMRQNDSLLEDRAQARRALELSDKSCEELMRKSQHQQRAIRSLVNQLRQAEGRAEAEQQQGDDERRLRLADLNETIDKQYEMIIELKRELDDSREELGESTNQLASARREVVIQQASLSEARAFLLQCLDDARRALLPTGAEGPPAGRQLQTLSVTDRVSVIEYLCRRMEIFESGFYPSAAPPSAVALVGHSTPSASVPIQQGAGGAGQPPRVPVPPSGSAWAPLGVHRPHPPNRLPSGKEAATTPGDRLPRIASGPS